MMPKISVDVSDQMAVEMDRIIRDGWFTSQESIFTEAIVQFVEGKTFLGDSPRMLHRFAADALNESKPETALKFVDRGLSLLVSREVKDFTLYQALIEMRVQILMVLDRGVDAMTTLEEAREKLPNSPAIQRWMSRLRKAESKGK